MRQRIKIAVVSITAFCLALSATVPAHAANATWFNSRASHNVKYTEGTVYQSRTGQLAGFTQTSYPGSARIRIWTGTTYTDCWDFQCQINHARNYIKGAFRWDYPGGTAGETIGARATALNVGPLARSASESDLPQKAKPISTDVSPVEDAAQGFGLRIEQLRFLGKDEGLEFFTAEENATTYFFISHPQGWVVSTSRPTTVVTQTGLPLAFGDETQGSFNQYFLLPESMLSLKKTKALPGFELVADNVLQASSADPDDLSELLDLVKSIRTLVSVSKLGI